MAPNHGGDPLGSILGPMGSHWVTKMVQKRKKLPCPKIWIFDFPGDHRLFLRNGSNGYGDKSRWGPPRVHLGVIVSKKRVKSVKNYHAPKFEFSTTPDHRFFPKMEVTVMAPNHGWDPVGSILGPMGSHWVQKMGQNRKKLPCPKIRIFNYCAVIDFCQKMEVTVMAPSHGGDPVGSILWSMGSHWVQKMGQNRTKLPYPKIQIFDYPAIIDFSQKMEVTVMATNHGGDPLRSILGPVGSHWVKKMVQKRKKLPCPKIRIFDYPAIIDFS